MAENNDFETTYSLKDVGNVIKLRSEIDQENRIADHIRSHLSVTDIIPTDYYLSLGLIDQGQWAISYDPEPAISEYKAICGQYDLEDASVSGVRLWLTDDSVAVDSMTNNYDPNVIEDAINSLTGSSRMVQSLQKLSRATRSAGTSSTPNQLLGGAENALTDIGGLGAESVAGLFADADVRSQISEAGSVLAKTAAGVVFHGKKLSLPKIWKSTTYSPSLTLTIKLVSPYGDPKAIKSYIIEPLMYIMILASPRTKDGITYGLPRPVWVNGYGSTSLNLAYIETVNIRRGGRETSYNIHKQPLVLDVALTIKPLTEGFAAVDKGVTDWTTMKDADQPASENPGTSRPAITTVANLINSLRPAPESAVGLYRHYEQHQAGSDVGSTITASVGITSQVLNGINLANG